MPFKKTGKEDVGYKPISSFSIYRLLDFGEATSTARLSGSNHEGFELLKTYLAVLCLCEHKKSVSKWIEESAIISVSNASFPDAQTAQKKNGNEV